jgi:Divergent InlB B-repeat domain
LIGALVSAVAVVAASYGATGRISERATVDRPDDSSGPQVHFLYVVARDGADRSLDVDGTITRSVDSFQAWLRRQTQGRALAVDTYQGALDVTFFRLATDNARVADRGIYVREQIEQELFDAGFDSPNKLYAVYYDGSSNLTCGGGDPQPSVRGSFAALYLQGTPPGAPPCASNRLGVDPPGYFEFAMLHEIVHTLGFVAPCAPHVTRVDHVSDSPFDLMWAGDAPWGTNEPSRMQLDVGHDDYYGHGRPDCPDLARSPYLTPPEQAALAVTVSGAGAVGVRDSVAAVSGTCRDHCSVSFFRGDQLVLTATPADGSLFAGWAGACTGMGDCQLDLNAGTAVTARFTRQAHDFTVTVRGPGRVRYRSVSCARHCTTTVEDGRNLVLRAIPKRGARFVTWGGACHGRNPCHLSVTRPRSVSARFVVATAKRR